MAAEHYKLTVNFDDNIEKVEFTGQMVVTVTDANKGQEIDVTLGGSGYETDVNVTCKNGYKLKSAILSGGWQTNIAEPLTNPFKVYPVGNGQGTITLASEAESSLTVKKVSSDNLARFKQKCDETYAKIGEGGGGVNLYSHQLIINRSYYYYISSSETPCNSLSELQGSDFIFGCKKLEISSPVETKFVIAVFSSTMLYINVTGTFQGATGADFNVIDLSSVTISDTVTPL